MPQKPQKGFDKFGYGALALYASGVAVVALAVYGINVSTIISDQNRSERDRARVQSGRMVVITEDRTQCRSIRFNNETAELGRETLMDCDARIGSDSGGSFNIFRDGFTNR
jgi:hypothetical protein